MTYHLCECGLEIDCESIGLLLQLALEPVLEIDKLLQSWWPVSCTIYVSLVRRRRRKKGPFPSDRKRSMRVAVSQVVSLVYDPFTRDQRFIPLHNALSFLPLLQLYIDKSVGLCQSIAD